MADWRTEPAKYCPCCKRRWQPDFCAHCGYLRHYLRDDAIEDIARGKSPETLSHYYPKPAAMSSDEHALRLSLFAMFLTSPASNYLGRLLEFADWLAENDRREEAAARAGWTLHMNKAKDPRGWWRWTAAGHPDWWRPKPSERRERRTVEQRGPGWSMSAEYEAQWQEQTALKRAKDRSRTLAGIQTRQHNSRWFLGWPPGWVKFTQPAHQSGRWWVTVLRRGLIYSHAYELNHAEGFTRLFHPIPVANSLPLDSGTDAGLFSEV